MKKDFCVSGAKTLKVLAITFALGLLAMSVSGGVPASAADKDADKPVDAPDFTLPSISGESVTLSKLKGKWVFVNFWATWCGPCVVEMPMLNKLYNKLKGDRFEMIAVSIDDLPADRIKKFTANLGVDFTILLDRKNITGNLYGIVSIPLTYIVDPDGKIVSKANGMREWDSPEVVDYFQNLMNEGTKNTKDAENKNQSA